MIDVSRPFPGVRIKAAAETGKQAKLKMIVAVDQAGKQQVPGDINLSTITIAANAACADCKIHFLRVPGIRRHSSAAEPDVSSLHAAPSTLHESRANCRLR
jgi:hypothetical protein